MQHKSTDQINADIAQMREAASKTPDEVRKKIYNDAIFRAEAELDRRRQAAPAGPIFQHAASLERIALAPQPGGVVSTLPEMEGKEPVVPASMQPGNNEKGGVSRPFSSKAPTVTFSAQQDRTNTRRQQARTARVIATEAAQSSVTGIYEVKINMKTLTAVLVRHYTGRSIKLRLYEVKNRYISALRDITKSKWFREKGSPEQSQQFQSACAYHRALECLGYDEEKLDPRYTKVHHLVISHNIKNRTQHQ